MRHPVTDVTYFHAQAMCMAIGGDLMTDRQYTRIVAGPKGYRKHATPNGQLSGPNGEEYVASSIKQERTRPVDVEDPAFPTDTETGTRHYTGNVWKWMRNNPREANRFGYRGGCFGVVEPRFFDACYRGSIHLPDGLINCVGFLAAAPAQDSK